MLKHINVKEDILKDEKYDYLFSVEKINELATKGASFREATAKSAIPLKTVLIITGMMISSTLAKEVLGICASIRFLLSLKKSSRNLHNL